MTNARPVLPTDVIALMSSGRASRNEAWPRERVYSIDESLNPVATMFDQFVGAARGRGAWISADRQRLLGLAGARRRGGRRAWEVDYLADMSPDQDTLPYLVDCAIRAAGRSGAEKLFLRVRADSSLVSVVLSTGFTAYREETLYSRAEPIAPVAATSGLRAAGLADSYLIYRLYNAATPEAVRRSEAASFGEWQAANESRWLKNGVRLTEERSGQITSVLSAARFGKSLGLELLDAEPAEANVIGLAAAAAQALHTSLDSIQMLVPETEVGLAARLVEAGFEPKTTYTVLMRRTTIPLALPKRRPIIAQSAVGA